ncbi:MAG: ATP-binding protein, partial [Natronospirillum sp.]
ERRLGVYQTSLQATINRHQYLPRVLASDPRVVEPLKDHAMGEALPASEETSALLALMNRQAGSDEIFIMDADGLTHWSSNYLSTDSFVGNNYGFRPYFRDAIAGTEGFYYAVGATSGKPGLFFSKPVSLDAENLGVVVVKIDLQPLEKSWQASGDQVWVTDEKGVIFLSSEPRWHYHATQALDAAQTAQLAATKQYGADPIAALTALNSPSGNPWPIYDLDGQSVLTFPAPIKGYPWLMHWRVPLERIENVVRAQQAIAIIGYLLIAGALLFLWERQRRTDAQIAVAKLTAERETHQQAIIQNTDAGLLNLDEGFQPIFINQKARDLFLLMDDSGAQDTSQLINPWRPHARQQGPIRAEGVRSDGSHFPIIYTLNAIRVGEKDEFILTVQDITELTAAQVALEQANEALEHRVEARTRDLKRAQAALAQNQKLAALGRMSSAIAHEINQPITALRNYVASSHLLLEHRQYEPVANNLKKIEGLVDRLSNLSRQLRVFSGKRNTGTEAVALHAPVQYALDLLKERMSDHQIECLVHLGNPVLVQGNTMMLEQIIVNLLNNAIDALENLSPACIEIGLNARHENAVELTVIDNGPGMSTEQEAQIFEPFYTTKPVGKGVGLGLAISYSLARDIGADLSVSTPGTGGTRFSLKLILAESLPGQKTA